MTSIDALTSGIVIVTGTDTDAGKTVVTAVLAAALTARGRDVAVLKPAQTGLAPGEEGDVQQVGRLAGLPADRLHELARLPEPLAPTTAARRAGMAVPSAADIATAAVDIAARHDVLLEGAGGILVGLDNEGRTLLDVADALADLGRPALFVVATRAGLGTLNHTGLTCAAIRDRGHEVAGVVIGSLPAEPDLATRCNLDELADAAGAPLLGAVPAGIGNDPAAVAEAARSF